MERIIVPGNLKKGCDQVTRQLRMYDPPNHNLVATYERNIKKAEAALNHNSLKKLRSICCIFCPIDICISDAAKWNVMSTYLVAFVVGLFDYIEETTSDGVKVRGCCPVGKSEKGKLALSISVKYFSMPYTLPKLDMVDVLEFSGRVMENYRSITYRKPELLHDDLNSAISNTQRSGYGVPPTSQTGYGTQPSRYDSYRPPLTQKPLGAAAAQTGYAQPAYGAPPAYSTAGYA
ncbi:aminopeptidase M1-like protein isoform X1 [Tanacetum coccineum]